VKDLSISDPLTNTMTLVTRTTQVKSLECPHGQIVFCICQLRKVATWFQSQFIAGESAISATIDQFLQFLTLL